MSGILLKAEYLARKVNLLTLEGKRQSTKAIIPSSHFTHQVKSKIKEAGGKAVGNEVLEAEGI